LGRFRKVAQQLWASYAQAVTNAKSPTGDEFGMQNVKAILKGYDNDSLSENLFNLIHSELCNFTKKTTYDDDTSFLIIKIT